MARVDSTQWPTQNIANSCNNWADFLTGYALAADSNFTWDNTNHTKLPIGTIDLVEGQTDYSFQTDEDGNEIITLLGVSILVAGYYVPLKQTEKNEDMDAQYGQLIGVPTEYKKIADNIIRLNYKPSSANQTLAAGCKMFFQRVSPRIAATDTNVTTGFSPLLDRGFIVASAYDAAFTLGLSNYPAISAELQKETAKVVQYFKDRTEDEPLQNFSGECINAV
jgi:hypothetical protein